MRLSENRIAAETDIDHAALSIGKCGLSMTSLDALAEYLKWEIKIRPDMIARE